MSRYKSEHKKFEKFVEQNIELTEGEKKSIDLSSTNLKEMIDFVHMEYWHKCLHPQTSRTDPEVFAYKDEFEFFYTADEGAISPWEENGMLDWIVEGEDEYPDPREEVVQDDLKNVYFKIANQVLEFSYQNLPENEKFWKNQDITKDLVM